MPAQHAQVVFESGEIVAVGSFPAGVPDPALVIVPMTPAIDAAWADPGTKILEEDGSVTVIPPPPPPVQYDRGVPVKAQVRTTDDVPLEVFRFPCEQHHLYEASLTIRGIDAGTFVVKRMEGRFVWKRLTADAIVVGLTVVSDIHNTAAESWLPNYHAAGADVVFTVQGAAGRTLDWLLDGTVSVFAPGGLEA